jgi:hypothetical protein
MNIFEDIQKEYYIISCSNFIYYPKIVHVVGMAGSCCNEQIKYLIDSYDYLEKNEEFYKEQLEKYKNFEECEIECKRLNNIPKNKKTAKQWNSIETQYNLLKARNYINK